MLFSFRFTRIRPRSLPMLLQNLTSLCVLLMVVTAAPRHVSSPHDANLYQRGFVRKVGNAVSNCFGCSEGKSSGNDSPVPSHRGAAMPSLHSSTAASPTRPHAHTLSGFGIFFSPHLPGQRLLSGRRRIKSSPPSQQSWGKQQPSSPSSYGTASGG